MKAVRGMTRGTKILIRYRRVFAVLKIIVVMDAGHRPTSCLQHHHAAWRNKNPKLANGKINRDYLSGHVKRYLARDYMLKKKGGTEPHLLKKILYSRLETLISSKNTFLPRDNHHSANHYLVSAAQYIAAA